MENITNSFNEIIISKTLLSQQTYKKEITSTEFSSFLNDDSIKEEKEIEKPSNNVISSQLELQNLSYLNKVFLYSVA